MLEQIFTSAIASLITPASIRVVKFLINRCLNYVIPKEILPKRQHDESIEEPHTSDDSEKSNSNESSNKQDNVEKSNEKPIEHELSQSWDNFNGSQDKNLDTKENLEINAHKGDMKAQFNLGVLYYRGRGNGIPKSFVLAYMWWNIASANGHEEAEIRLAIVSGEMTREGVEKAQEKTTEMVGANPNLIKSSEN